MTQKNSITRQMTMQDVEKTNPQTREILAPFHIGACKNCEYDSNDTLESVADKNGAPVALLLQLLNESR